MTSLGGLQAVTEATYSSILNVEFLLETFDEDLVVTFVQSLDPRRKKRAVESIFQTIDAFGFVPSSELHYYIVCIIILSMLSSIFLQLKLDW